MIVLVNMYRPLSLSICLFTKMGTWTKQRDVSSLDALQSLIDRYGELAPLKLCGDFNAQPPKQAKLNRNWHKEGGKGFTSHSALLYNFLVANELFRLLTKTGGVLLLFLS